MVAPLAGAFHFEDCLLKHHVRMTAWLPLCRERLKRLRKGRKEKEVRRLRYFTFCAIGAIDVFLLALARILRKSGSGHFDTVSFFQRDADAVAQTNNRIPGASGIPGDFVEVVLAVDPFGDDPDGAHDPLDAPSAEADTRETRDKQRLLSARRSFIQRFPFDVVNLDLEGYLFKPTDRLPGRLVNALMKVFEWQRRPIPGAAKFAYLDGFSLMLTTSLGPTNLGDDYLEMLRRYLRENIAGRPELEQALENRTGLRDLGRIEAEQFETFFTLAVPKLIASLLHETDWFVDPDHGIDIYEFERPTKTAPYKMLHLVMQVRRKEPRLENRGPGQHTPEAARAYEQVVDRLFAEPVRVVTNDGVDAPKLRESLDRLKGLRRQIYPEGE